MRYKYRYIDNLSYKHLGREELSARILARTYKTAISNYLLEGRKLTIADVYRIASRLWKTFLGFVPSSTEIDEVLTLDGQILEAIEFLKQEKIIFVDYPVSITLDSNLIIEDKIDIISKEKTTLKLTYFDYSASANYRYGPYLSLRSYTGTTCVSRELMGEGFNLRIFRKNLYNSKNYPMAKYSLIKKDILPIINAVNTGIKNNLFFPCSNIEVCKECYYKPICKFKEVRNE